MARSMAPRHHRSRLRGRHQRQPAACVPPHPICPCTKEAPRSSAGPREPTLEVGMCGCGNSLSSALQRLQPVMPTALGRGRVTYTLQQASHLPDQRRRRNNHLRCFRLPAVQSHTPPITPQERIPAAAASREGKPDGAGRWQRRGAGAHRGGPWKTGSYRLPCRPHGRRGGRLSRQISRRNFLCVPNLCTEMRLGASDRQCLASSASFHPSWALASC